MLCSKGEVQISCCTKAAKHWSENTKTCKNIYQLESVPQWMLGVTHSNEQWHTWLQCTILTLSLHCSHSFQMPIKQLFESSRNLKMREQTLARVRQLLGPVLYPFHNWCNAPVAGPDQEPSVLPMYVTQATADMLSLSAIILWCIAAYKDTLHNVVQAGYKSGKCMQQCIPNFGIMHQAWTTLVMACMIKEANIRYWQILLWLQLLG